MSKEKKVIYEPHPVSAERKAELVKSGYKILDVIFQPVELEPVESIDNDESDEEPLPQLEPVELLAPTKQKPKGGQPK